MILLIGLTGTVSQFLTIRALRLADVSFVTPFEYLRVPLIAAAGWYWFGERPDLWFALGAAVIFCSIAVLARASRPRGGPRP